MSVEEETEEATGWTVRLRARRTWAVITAEGVGDDGVGEEDG